MNPTDLRQPDVDETPLSQPEVLHGLREGSIAAGPRAQAMAFQATVYVLEPRRAEVVDFYAGRHA